MISEKIEMISNRFVADLFAQSYGGLGVSNRTAFFFPQAPSCPPRGWSGAGVGVGMLRGGGIPLLENNKYWFQRFKLL